MSFTPEQTMNTVEALADLLDAVEQIHDEASGVDEESSYAVAGNIPQGIMAAARAAAGR